MDWSAIFGVLVLAGWSADQSHSAWTIDEVGRVRSACRAAENEAPIWRAGDETLLCISGSTDEAMLEAFQALGPEPFDGVRAVQVTSQGGALWVALEIAEPLSRAELPVIAQGLCISSCAQFIFMAGSPKIVAPNSVVAMHGGPLRLDRLISGEFDAEAERNLLRESLRFYEFYDRLDIDIDIVKTPPPSVQERLANGEIVFWAPTLEDYHRYGADNVIMIEGPEPSSEP